MNDRAHMRWRCRNYNYCSWRILTKNSLFIYRHCSGLLG